ncbi:hypothetical protein IK110_01655 [Candidatus Saccharibacteria bacterium]|nr:hypothetical protein [Candidatus Saccharibacteria bacterium]
MNEQIKMSIDGRRNAVEAAYELNDAAKKKLDSLFEKIEALGKECKDSADFEAKIAASPLNQEYINLFTEFATTCKSKMAAPDTSAEMPSAGDVAADLIKTQADLSVDGAIQTVRGRAYRAGYDKLRDVPGVGDAISIKNKIDLFKRFKG